MAQWTYEKAGVPHLKGDAGYNRKITKLIRSTQIPGVLGSATGFAALFDFKKTGVSDPLLVTSTDGVGTKLEVARLQDRHDTIGIDLVAMCVNDLITCGARPIIFLDYFATGRFDEGTAFEVLEGITEGCREAGCALVGGETAIMPGFYTAHAKNGRPKNVGEPRRSKSGKAGKKGFSQYDLAGFSVGLVDRRRIIDGRAVRKGDVLLGLESSGFHSNGYSLLRKIFTENDLRGKIGRELLTPTRIYVQPVLKLLKSVPLSGIINITGGGVYDNIPRVLPKGMGAVIRQGSWPVPKLFELVKDSGNIHGFEMLRTFNCGIGMVLILKGRDAVRAQKLLARMKIRSWVIGETVRGEAVEVV